MNNFSLIILASAEDNKLQAIHNSVGRNITVRKSAEDNKLQENTMLKKI